MEQALEKVLIEFNTRAQRLFFMIYEKFEVSVKRLDRRKDENVFQQHLSKHLQTLKLQLESIAGEMMDKYKSIENVGQLRNKVTGMINFYQQEFIQKSQSH